MTFTNNNRPVPTPFQGQDLVSSLISAPASFPASSQAFSLAHFEEAAAYTAVIKLTDPTGLVFFGVEQMVNGSWAPIEPIEIMVESGSKQITGESSADAIRVGWYGGDAASLEVNLSVRGEVSGTAGLATPRISSFPLTALNRGGSLTIQGYNLSDATIIFGGGGVGAITSNTATEIQVDVPLTAVPGDLQVLTSEGIAIQTDVDILLTAHRYWRIYVTDTAVTNQTFPGSYNIEMRSVADGPDLIPPSAPGAFSTDAPANVDPVWAFNDNNFVWYENYSDLPFAIGYDFGDGNDVEIVQVAIMPSGSGSNTSNLRNAFGTFDVQYSDDGTNYTTKNSFVTGDTYVSDTFKVFDLN